MNRVERLIHKYERFVGLPWEQTLAGPQRVWFAVYDKTDERRIRLRLSEFELATRRAGHGWTGVDLTDAFGIWMSEQEYRDSYFEDPSALDLQLPCFEEYVVGRIQDALGSHDTTDNDVVAVTGIAALFGFVKVSSVVQRVAKSVSGRLLLLFPGIHEGNNYRLLDARDGWNYLAVPITIGNDAEGP